ncbi:MAG: TRAP transporter small permease [Pseudomonadota bacterium]
MLYHLGKGFCRFSQGINRVISWLVIALLTVLVGIVVVSVFYRYALDASLTWSSEAARYLCIWTGFLAASVALRQRMHIGLAFFTDRMGEKAEKILKIASHLATLFFLVFAVYLGFQLAGRQMRQTSPALMLPMGVPYLAIPVSCILMGFQSLSLLITDIFNLPEDQEEEKKTC